MSIGYACTVIGREEKYSLRSCTLKNLSEDKLSEITLHNLRVLDNMIDYNIKNNIKLFRLSSDIIPFGSHPINMQKWWVIYEEQLKNIGDKLKKAGIRISMHPGQYTVLNSKDQSVALNAAADLAYHVRLLDVLDTDISNKIILHIGGVYDDKSASIERFVENYNKLPIYVKKRIVIENDEKCYNIAEVLEIGKRLDIPVVFDNLHHIINHPGESKTCSFWINECSSTWHQQDGRQKIHYSQQAFEGKTGAHSRTIDIEEFLNFYKELENKDIDIMLEVKDKNLSAVKCMYVISNDLPFKYIESEWAKYKYFVLSHSQPIYLQIRKLLKNKNENPAVPFYKMIQQASQIVPLAGDEINAANHVWGYFKNIADEDEKRKMNKLVEEYKKNSIGIGRIKKFLYRLVIKYDTAYLNDSYYFII